MLLVGKAVALATECCIVNALRARMNRLLRQNAERICNTAVSRGNGFRIGAQMEQLCIASDAVIIGKAQKRMRSRSNHAVNRRRQTAIHADIRNPLDDIRLPANEVRVPVVRLHRLPIRRRLDPVVAGIHVFRHHLADIRLRLFKIFQMLLHGGIPVVIFLGEVHPEAGRRSIRLKTGKRRHHAFLLVHRLSFLCSYPLI